MRDLIVLFKLLSALGMGLGMWWLLRTSSQHPVQPPQLIFVAGGFEYRERHAARLAREHNLPVLVSGGLSADYGRALFVEEGVQGPQLSRDDQAGDTLENFTTLLAELQQRQVRHLLLVTGVDHMPRASLVGRIVAGSRGIQVTPAPVDCGNACIWESPLKVAADGLRAVIWVVSGQDVKTLVLARGLVEAPR
ncbi:YdcF family protein [Candidatus Synechococcus spongiarum]|uniref:YdcF family protein n=1 Tax=Candidatus Synechococcus spongiarum TaxID=431041 RepID=UPI00047063C9|nr:YdcF family protein [Candidatus Synechococcus spongiarum]